LSVPLEELVRAIDEAKRLAKPRRFTQSVELIIKLRDVDVRKPENRINISVRLPHPPKEKPSKVCVIANGDMAVRAKRTDADAVITREELERVAASKREPRKLAKSYDFFIAEAPLMPTIGRLLGRYLGPRGKMPQPVPPTADIEGLVRRFKESVRVRLRDQPQIMCRIGLESQDSKELAENALAVISAIGTKFRVPQNIERMYVKLTMGPAVEVKFR